MFTLSCKDLGNPACPFVAKANTEDETVAKMIKHAKREHAADMTEMGSMDDIKKMMLGKVKNI
jgi:predicted small metal-binding protein